MEILDTLLYMLAEMAPYVLLGFFIAGVMHAFVSQRTMARHLSGNGFMPVFKAAAIGVPLPLCSCGVLPAGISMHRGGASKAATTSFLIATPQTGADSIAATWSLLGPAFAVIRPVAALATALGGGMVAGRFDLTKPSKSVPDADTVQACVISPEPKRSFWQKLVEALRYGFFDLVDSIGLWLVIGLIVAALITVYVPADFFTFFGPYPIVAMIAVLIVAIPMYVCATGSIPIAMSLMLKGLSPGTALVLLMAGPAANFASFTLISHEMGRKAATVYIAAVAVGAIVFGLFIDYVLVPWGLFGSVGTSAVCIHHHAGVFTMVCAGILATLLLFSLIKRYFFKHKTVGHMSKQYLIKGMNCPHCQASVTRAIASVKGVKNVDVDLQSGKAVVEGDPADADVAKAVRDAGFDME